MKTLFSCILCAIITVSTYANAELFPGLEINCSNDTVLFVDEASCGKVFFHLPPEIISSSGPVSFTLVSGLNTGSIFPIGEMLQTWQAIDSTGNSVLCSYIVEVIDNISPEIDCPNDIILPVLTDCMSSLPNFLIGLDYSDNCSNNLNLTQTPEPGALIQTSTIVLLEIVDQFENSNTCAFYAMPDSIDNTLSVDENTITSNFDGAIYQWVDCSGPKPLPIAGEVAQSYTASQSGSYALLVTQGTCTVQSECLDIVISNVLEIEGGHSFTVFPNPTSGIVSLALNADVNKTAPILIQNAIGQTAMEFEMTTNRPYTIDLSHLHKGNYSIFTKSSNGIYKKHIILL